MNGKGFRSSQIAVAIATSLAVSGTVMPIDTYAKARAIAVVGSDAIAGTGVDAIAGTGRSKPASNSAIAGTGKGSKNNAIAGTGIDAIAGTGIDAIAGTGRSKPASNSAIAGTGKGSKNNAIAGTGIDAIAGTGIDAIAGTGRSTVVLMGAIDAVDAQAKTITLLNRTLQLGSIDKVQTAFTAGEQIIAVVSGRLSSSGKLQHSSLRLIAGYVPGVSQVVVSGRVSEANLTLGTIKISGQLIDITSSIGSKEIKAGDVVTVVGTQPVRNGTVLASNVH